MTNGPRVSVLVTAYNRDGTVARTIESILDSSYDDFELIAVDDASEDATWSVLRQYASDQRVAVFRNASKLGDYRNRNRAASLATGEYLKYVDSDDAVHPEGLAVLVEAMDRHPQVGLGVCRPLEDGAANPGESVTEPRDTYWRHFTGREILYKPASECIVRRTVFEAAGGFSGKRFCGDSEMWLRLAARLPVLNIPGDWVDYHPAAGGEFEIGMNSGGYLIGDFEVAMQALQADECPLHLSERKRLTRYVRRGHARTIWATALRNRRVGLALRAYRHSGLSMRELLQGLRRPPRLPVLMDGCV